MVSANESIESFFNSIQVFKEALAPLELSIRRAAKDFEVSWGERKRKRNGVELITHVSVVNRNSEVQISSDKKKNRQCVIGDERKKVFIMVPIKTILGMFSQNKENGDKVEVSKEELKERCLITDNGTCANCLQVTVHWSLLVSSLTRTFPSPFKVGQKQFRKPAESDLKQKELNSGTPSKGVVHKADNHLSIECLIGFLCEQLAQNLPKFDWNVEEKGHEGSDISSLSQSSAQNDNWMVVTSMFEGRKRDVNGLLGNLRFARMAGVPSGIVGAAASDKVEGDDCVLSGSSEKTVSSSMQKLASGIFSIPLSNVERLRSTISTVSFTELIELVPHLGRSSKEHPDKKKLFSVQDFFRYTESEGRRFFEELDRDGDGQVTLEDLEIEMRKRKLPRKYAREFMSRARNHIFSKSFGWKRFLSVMEQKEPTILRAYTSLCLSKSGTLQKSQILASLKNAGLPANEDNAMVMMRFLNADTEESISYGHFRNFMLLLPSDRLQGDPRSIWFEAATVVAVAPPVDIPAGSVLRSALAGGLSCAFSTSLMHPVDTIKTHVQASTLSFPEIISKLPQVGVQGLYRGSIPAIIGQFSSHGLRTGIFEASKLVLINVAPTLPDIQVQSLASFCSTFLGTVVRIPCEVLKQRLQAGIFDNVGEAILGTWTQDGLKGFFRGTGATLCREVPFYVAGTGLYAESKKVAQHLLGRDLEPWETIAVGALSGGLTAVVTTPFDVMKTRTMTAPEGGSVSMSALAFSILRHEGPLGLFKGALPRFFWVAPLGAINFAGYELARKAMDKSAEPVSDQISTKKLTTSG